VIVLIRQPGISFWKGTNNKGIHLVNWKKVTSPKQLGGLGIRKARDANTCLLGKLVWDMVQSTNKLWVNILTSKYSKGPNILHATRTSNSSPSWSSIIKAKNILCNGYQWRAGSGSSSFWFQNWSSHGLIGSLVPIIDIHDIHLTVRDVFTHNGHHSQALYTILPPTIADSINNTSFRFNDRVEDTFIWSYNTNGVYTAKSGYSWLLCNSGSDNNQQPSFVWSWIWKLKIPEKFKLLIWLVCHNAIPTLSLLHHRQMAPSATCLRCGEDEESILHCLRDCRFSSQSWLQLGFADNGFFNEGTAHNWIKTHATRALSSLFLAGLWWTWRHHNSMCLSNDSWSLPHIIRNIHHTVADIENAFHEVPGQHAERMIRWNNDNYGCVVLNVDGSCLGTPIRTGYGGVMRNSAGFFLEGFSGSIATTTDILFAELTAIHRGLSMAIEKGIEVLVCYSDSLLSVKLLNNSTSRFHAYAVLIQDIKDILSSRNFSIHHCLREGNQCADFMAKLGAASNEEFVRHTSAPYDLLPLIRIDAMGTAFPRALASSFFLFFFPFVPFLAL